MIITKIIARLGEGTHYCGWYKGWISVYKEDGLWDVMWCSSKHTHNPQCGPAVSVEFRDDGNTGLVFKSALSMHLVQGGQEKIKRTNWMRDKIIQAVRKSRYNGQIL